MSGSTMKNRFLEAKLLNNPADSYVTVFADASYCPQTGAYGWCFWVKFGSPAQTKVHHGGGAYVLNSLMAEVEALLKALEFVESIPLDGKIVVLQSDCTGALNFPRVKSLMEKLVQLGAKRAYVKHVKGHQGTKDPRSAVNTMCDRNARNQMRKHRKKVTI